MNLLQLNLFGDFQLRCPQQGNIAVTAKKIKALLAYLALQPGIVHQREQLAELLWEDCSAAQARHNLRQTLSTLRKLIPAAAQLLSTTQQTLAFSHQLIDIDVLRFDALCADESKVDLKQAFELYRGDLLPSFYIRSQEFDDWLETERSHRRETALRVMDDLLQLADAAGAPEQMIRLGIRMTALDPLRESAHRGLMEAYRRQGRRGAALKQYRSCQKLLRAELDVAPESSTQTLFRSIYRQASSVETEPLESFIVEHAAASSDISNELIEKASMTRHLRQVSLLYIRTNRNLSQVDPELQYQQQQQTYHAMQHCLRGLDAEAVTLHDGDLLVLFGLRIATTNDTAKAVRAAFALRQNIGDDATCLLKIGISCGQLYVPEYEGDQLPVNAVTGMPLQQAMTLAEKAKPGQIFIAERAYATIASLVRAERLNYQDPQEQQSVWCLIRYGQDQVSSATIMVGRQYELQQLQSAMQTCVDNNCGRVFIIRGEPGIGKSRLLNEWRTLALTAGFASHCCAVFDFGTAIDQHPIQMMLSSLLQLPSEIGMKEIQQQIRQIVTNGWLDEDQCNFLFDLLNLPELLVDAVFYQAMDNEARQEGKQEALESLIRHLAMQTPLLLIVEDIHWADATLLTTLGCLALAVKDCAVILALSTRVEGEPCDVLWNSRMQSVPLSTLDLCPLNAGDADTLLSQMSALPTEKVQQIIARAGGNPLYLEQLLFCAQQPLENIPDSVQNIVAAKLDTLAMSDKRAIFSAAILGQRFSHAALKFMLDDREYDCSELLVKGLIEPSGSRLQFHHALIMEGIYAIQLPSQRRSLHRLAANWYQEKDPVLYAEHLDKAESESADEAYLQAAEYLFKRYRYDEAEKLIQRAGEISQSNAMSFKLTLLRGECLREMGQSEAALAAFVTAATRVTSIEHQCQALLGQGFTLRLLDRHEEVLTVTRSIEPLAKRLPDYPALATLYYLRGNAYFFLGMLDDCLKSHQQAEALATSHQLPLLKAQALSGIADAYYGRGRLISAVAKYQQCVALCEQYGFLRDAAVNAMMRGAIASFLNRFEEAKKQLADALEMSVKVRNRRAEAMCVSELASIAMQQQQPETVRRYIEQNKPLLERLGSVRIQCDNLLYLGTAERNLELLEQSYAVASANSFGPFYISSWILATLAWVTDNKEQCDQALAEGERLLMEHSLSHNFLMFYRYAIEACLKHKMLDRAEYYIDALARYTAPEPLPWSDFIIHRAQCLIRSARGEASRELIDDLNQILNQADEIGFYEAKGRVEDALLTLKKIKSK